MQQIIAWTPCTWRALAVVVWWVMVVRWVVVGWMVCESAGGAEKAGVTACPSCVPLLAVFPLLGGGCSPTMEGSQPQTLTHRVS